MAVCNGQRTGNAMQMIATLQIFGILVLVLFIGLFPIFLLAKMEKRDDR